MKQTFFTSDTHFGHARIIDLCDRPFDHVDDMNEMIIKRWNETVKWNDIVYHLGDVALGTIADSLPLVGRLNGTKVLVPGNHDRIFSKEKQHKINRFLPEYLKVFDVIMPEKFKSPWGWHVSHFPFQGDSHDEDRFDDMRPVDDGRWVVHGHVHEKWKVNGRQINVGVDVWDFTPVSIDEIFAIQSNGE